MAVPLKPGEFQLYGGGRFDPLNPDSDSFNIMDIAHALSNQCRFMGHVKTFYSVAQHSVLCSIYAEDVNPEVAKDLFKDCHTGKDLARMMLMHDASEAYIQDIIRPLKSRDPGFEATYKLAEAKIMNQLSTKFNFPWPMCPVGKMIDDRMLFTEKRDLLEPANWGWEAEPFEAEIDPWTPALARLYFLRRFHQLFAD